MERNSSKAPDVPSFEKKLCPLPQTWTILISALDRFATSGTTENHWFSNKSWRGSIVVWTWQHYIELKRPCVLRAMALPSWPVYFPPILSPDIATTNPLLPAANDLPWAIAPCWLQALLHLASPRGHSRIFLASLPFKHVGSWQLVNVGRPRLIWLNLGILYVNLYIY